MKGKFLHTGDVTSFVRGVTYGTFRPDPHGVEFPSRDVVIRDFDAMAANGINALRTYTVPPTWLLDEAASRGLGVMVGIPVERYVGYLTDRRNAPDVGDVVRRGVSESAGHPAVLCYSLGNEIPAATVRWHGRRSIERHLEHLYRIAKREHPDAAITYANYPSTEYLQLDFLDVVCFNVFLEEPERLAAYVARLQNIAGDRPLLLGELGLDSKRHGEKTQARNASTQIATAYAEGCAGVFVFSWTDEWHTGGGDVFDWQFGLTRRNRTAKPALDAVRGAFANVPFSADRSWPRVSVVVCSYNGATRLDDCLDGIARIDYPDYETIVVDNGSTDETSAVAASHPGVEVIRTPPTGLGDARNTGWRAATGEIIAYIDDDARPDPRWLTYLAHTFSTSQFSAVGGPNIPPAQGGLVSQCVRRAPGNPVHVLLSDREAEHIAGCNMAIRREALEDLGGFDPRFRVAGDDVDMCWRLREQGRTVGFSPAAMVWHDPRPTVPGFWRQQFGYGRAEGLLQEKWPERYNAAGQAIWSGRIYGGVAATLRPRTGRIYHGVWGTAPFQTLYTRAGGAVASLAGIPEWYLLLLALTAASLASAMAPALRAAIPLLSVAILLTLAQALRRARRVPIDTPSRTARARMRLVIAFLHLLQPVARMWGRARSGFTPWRRPTPAGAALPVIRTRSFWSETYREPTAWVGDIERQIRRAGAVMTSGGDFDTFDLAVRGGPVGSARLLVAVEEHGGGCQLVRTKVWPHTGRLPIVALLLGASATVIAAVAGSAVDVVVIALLTLAFGARVCWECATAVGVLHHSVERSVHLTAAETTASAA